MRILIGYDGSACADEALDDLRRAGLPREAEALIISVAEVWLPSPPPSSYEVVEAASQGRAVAGLGEPGYDIPRAIEQAHELAFQASKIVSLYFPSWDVRVESRRGSPAGVLLEKANEWDSDLIVLGSHGRSALGRLILGSVSQRVVTEAACSARVARGHAQKGLSPIRIIIGTDGSPDSDLAVCKVGERIWPQNSEVRLVTAVDAWHQYAIEPEEKYAFARDIHQVNETRLRAAGLTVSSVIKEENPRGLLLEEAEAWHADCIFLGARSHGLLGRRLLGSVSTAVVSRAHCSVEVVRARKSGDV
jgi:nucleotide-binding universal stress UspA family protein